MRLVLFAVGCAATSLSAQTTRATIGLPGFKDKFPIEDVTVPYTLDAPLPASYAAVKAAYADLTLTIDMDDPSAGLVGIQLVKSQTSFAGYRMSRLFDCGIHITNGPNADSYRLTIVFLALLDPQDATHTKLRLGMVAGAIPSAGTRADGLQCGSTGVLEAKLVELANARLK